MDYEKKYKEALEKAREWYNKTEPDSYTCIVESIFPELKENKEEWIEKLRKEIITFLGNKKVSSINESDAINVWIAWLKKQSDKKSTDNLTQQEAMDIAVAKCFNEQEAVDKVEPKFNVDDWICNSACIVHIASIKDGMYYFDEGDGLDITFVDNNYHLWSITDAKDGDILYSPCCKLLWIYKDEKTCHVGSNLNYNSGSIVINKPICVPTDVHPATKEQRDTLIKAMTDAGYTFDFDKKELKKIENHTTWNEEDKRIMSAISQLLKDCESENDWNCVYSNDREVFFADIEKWLKALKGRFSIHQNNLNADDEINYRILQEIICNSDTLATLANKLLNWLQSLKNRVIPQSKNEWSEEDEENLTDTCVAIRKFYHRINGAQELIDWLQSLKEIMKGEKE